MNKLLPQANDIDKIINVFTYIATVGNFNVANIASFCDFEPRQSSYYANACYFLGLLNEDYSLSDVGITIASDRTHFKANIYYVIASNYLVSKVLSQIMINGFDNLKQFVIKILEKDYAQYSFAVLERRASTLIVWCKQILKYISIRNPLLLTNL